MKSEKYIKFRDNHIPELDYFHRVTPHTEHAFKIETDEQGTYIYYPNPDRLLFTNDNKWFNNGLDYINKNLLP